MFITSMNFFQFKKRRLPVFFFQILQGSNSFIDNKMEKQSTKLLHFFTAAVNILFEKETASFVLWLTLYIG